MNRTLVFDAGPVISLATNNLLGILEPLRDLFHGDFVITPGVRAELVDAPLKTKKWMFEALQIQRLIEQGVLRVVEDQAIPAAGARIAQLANKALWARRQPMRIVQVGEMESVAYALREHASAMVVDERITRVLVEQPSLLQKLMSRRLHTRVSIKEDALREFHARTRSLKLIRSAELVAVAFEQGLLDEYLVDIPKARAKLLESVLWGVKLNGCALSGGEIRELMGLAKAR